MHKIFNHFLETQQEAATELSDNSDLVDIEPLDLRRYVVAYRCNGRIRTPNGDVIEHDHFAVGISFPDAYLRLVNPPEVLTWLGPQEIWHPNIRPPFICTGRITPGTPIAELVYRCFDLIAYRNVTMNEYDALNHAACVWARAHRDEFPVDVRPLKRRAQAPEVLPA